jgi:O-antigen ligase
MLKFSSIFPRSTTINIFSLFPGADWKHPNYRLQSAWGWTRIGFAIFPLLPSVGALAILVSLIQTWIHSWREIIQRRLNWWFVLLIPWLIIVSTLSEYKGDALLGLVNFIPYFLLFAAYSTLIQSPEQLRQLAWIFLIPAMPIMSIGLLQMVGLSASIPMPGIPSSFIWKIAAGGEPLGRMSSLFAHANPFAAYLQMVFIFALGLFVDTCDRYAKGIERKVNGLSFARSLDPVWKSPNFIWTLLSLIVCSICLIYTSSRAAWGGALLSSFVFTIYQGWYWILAGVTAISTVILSAAYGPSPIKEPLRSIVPRYFWARITDEMYPGRPESITRLSQWNFAWKMTQDRPITGWGLQSFGPLYQKQAHVWLGYPHDLLLMLTSNLGIPATVIIVGFVGWIIAQSTILILDFPMQWESERTIYFTFLIAFAGFMIFNIADVTALELRLNTHAWLILACLGGLVARARLPRQRILRAGN